MLTTKQSITAKIAVLVAGAIALTLTACGGEAATPPAPSSGSIHAAPTGLPAPTLTTKATETVPTDTSSAPAATSPPAPTQTPQSLADVLSVSVSGVPGAYFLSVMVESPDDGCSSYADWWEVVSEEGELVYRRVLLHSHVSEQPFVRSGGPVNIQPNEIVIVRAHMSSEGYGGSARIGTAADEFSQSETQLGFAVDLENQEPLPVDCAF